MTKPGWKGVLLRQEVVTRLEKLKEVRETGKPRKQALGAFIEELVWPVLEEDALLRRYGPFLQEFGVDQDKIFIKDNRTNELAELTFKDNGLYCSVDHSDNCVHIGFAWALPKVYKVLVSRGQRPRKVTLSKRST